LRLVVLACSVIRTRRQWLYLASATASAGSRCTTGSWLAARSWLTARITAVALVSAAEASFLARINRNLDSCQLLASYAFGNTHELFLGATAFIGDANALETANFLLIGNACQLLACFYATGIWLAAAAILSSANHWATQCDTHDR